MKFRNKDELKAWLDDIAEKHAQLTAERMIADGCDIDEVDEFSIRRTRQCVTITATRAPVVKWFLVRNV
jgi:hypothetical protein